MSLTGRRRIAAMVLAATIAVVAEDELSLEISPGVFVRMVPAAVARVIEPAPGMGQAEEPEPPTP